MRNHLFAGLCAASSLFAQEPSRLAAGAPVAAIAPSLQEARTAAARLGAGVLSRVLFDRPTADGPLWAVGRAWKASFDATGATVVPYFGAAAPRNFPLRLEVANASVGGEPLLLQPGAPVVVGSEVRTARGALTEVMATGLDQLEQSFVFDTLPRRGAIAVDVRIDTELAAAAIDGGLRFSNSHGHVDYTHAVAVDAKGERIELPIVWTGAAAHLEIPADFVARAQLPIVLDPLLMYWYALGSGITQQQHHGDVGSFLHGNGRVCFVWLRQWSATDGDCWGLMFDGGLGLVQTDFQVDFTTDDWREIAIAASGYAQNFLVVAESRTGIDHSIVGRTIADNAAVGARFDIERNGVVGLPGNSHHPDVGGDPYYGIGRYAVVFQKRNGTAADIYVRFVTPQGTLVGTGPTAIDTSLDHESAPAISKSCGASNGLPAMWLVAYQRTWPNPPNDQEVWGRFVNWNGAVVGNSFAVGFTANEETAPSPGSPIDAAGVRYWPIAYEYAAAPNTARDVVCRLYRDTGALAGATTVDAAGSTTDDREPHVDGDGVRFVVARTVGPFGGAQAVEAATFAWLPTAATFRVEDRSNLGTAAGQDFAQPNVCAYNSGSSGASAHYFVGMSELTTNTHRLALYGGWGGTAGFTTRPTQCGAAAAISASGTPALGQTITISSTAPFYSGLLLGFPGNAPIAGCGCTLGVAFPQSMPNPLVWAVPANPDFVGLPLSVQAFTFSGAACFGSIDVSDTVDFTIR